MQLLPVMRRSASTRFLTARMLSLTLNRGTHHFETFCSNQTSGVLTGRHAQTTNGVSSKSDSISRYFSLFVVKLFLADSFFFLQKITKNYLFLKHLWTDETCIWSGQGVRFVVCCFPTYNIYKFISSTHFPKLCWKTCLICRLISDYF